jgi:hypothetical protein
MLKSDGASLDHPKGLNNRFVYFCYRNYFIRGQNELRETCAHQFELHVNKNNEEFLRCFLNLYFIEYFYDIYVIFSLLFGMV